ncbi:acylglycerol lipase [Aureococcus anophagefferens]|nr:acylglycerol lipase [Aureococcus anophagefferens]
MRVAALALLLALGRVGGEACGGDALLEVHEELDHGDVCRSVRDRSSWSCPADCAPAEGREAPYCVNGHGAPCRSAARRDAPTCGGGGRPVFAARRDRGDVCRKKRKIGCPSDCVPRGRDDCAHPFTGAPCRTGLRGLCPNLEAHDEVDHGDVCRGDDEWHCPPDCRPADGRPFCANATGAGACRSGLRPAAALAGRTARATAELVVAHCAGNVGWVNFVAAELRDCGVDVRDVYVYSKCGDAEGARRKLPDARVERLSNVGGEHHTYAHHLFRRVSSGAPLHQVVLFFKDEDLAPELRKLAAPVCATAHAALGHVGFGCGRRPAAGGSALHMMNELADFDPGRDRGGKQGRERHNGTHAPARHEALPLRAWLQTQTLLAPLLDRVVVAVCYGGIFGVHRSRVAKIARATWRTLERTLYTHERSSNALMERTWAALLAREQPAKRYKRALCAARRRGDDGVLDGCACGCACDAASGECADPKARGVLPGWGLEMPYGATCVAGAPCDLRGPAPAPAFEGAMSHRATPRPPETVDVVVAAYDRPAAPMVASLLRALPYRAVHVRVFSYCKRAGGCAAGDAAALRRLAGDRGGRGVQIFTEQLPNVGRCDHTYLAHVARTYDDLANATFFLKDTTVWHDHLGAMANVLTFAAALPRNLEAFCARRQGREARAFELPTYKSEQCARFGNCYADEAYARGDARRRAMPHREPALHGYDVSLYVDAAARGVDVDAAVAAVYANLERPAIGLRPRRVLGRVAGGELASGLVEEARLSDDPPDAEAVAKAQAFVAAKLRELAKRGNSPPSTAFDGAFVLRRTCDAAAAFGDAWFDYAAAAGPQFGDVALHFAAAAFRADVASTDRPIVDPRPAMSSAAPRRRAPVATWVFLATGDASPAWVAMTKRAVVSALERTSLKPVCVFWGPRSAPLALWLAARGVEVVHHAPLWLPLLERALNTTAGRRNVKFSPLYASPRSLASTFLRVDVPLLLDPAVHGDVVLYADTDVLFLDGVAFGAAAPEFFSLGAETPRAPNYGNAGVMLLNLAGLRRTYAAFLDWIFSPENVDRGLHFGDYGPGDQGAYASFYRGRFDVANWPAFNWRPYWPYAPGRASLLHFHGPKPDDYRDFLRDGGAGSPLHAGILARCDAHPWVVEPGYPGGKRDGTPDHCARWMALYDCAADDVAERRAAPPSPDCVSLLRRHAIHRATTTWRGVVAAALAAVVAALAFWRRHQSRPRAVSDDTQMAKAL